MRMAKEGKPFAVVIGHQGLLEGPARLTCELCKKPYPVQLSTAVTVAQNKNMPNRLPVVCWACLTSILDERPHLRDKIDVGGMKAAREALGMEPL